MKKLCPALTPPEAAAIRPANDSEPLVVRLADFATRACRVPEATTPYEIKQLGFAVLIQLAVTDETWRSPTLPEPDDPARRAGLVRGGVRPADQ